MKKIIALGLVLVSSFALAQEVGVKVNKIPADGNQDTTISISKGSKQNTKHYTVSEGNEDISGDQDVMTNKAQANWKKACSDWKVEFKDLNKQNSIISMSCGSMKCERDGIQYTCSSQAAYKVRVLAEE